MLRIDPPIADACPESIRPLRYAVQIAYLYLTTFLFMRVVRQATKSTFGTAPSFIITLA
ncbi:hypothetical protein MKY48_14465 [Paenibacillus sp. FSL W8-0187]|uniref:hypothetical protein n=1 Tax=Paenibacillus sp. FSL W8-0187 TaxID=2921710 RepID=UPI0030DC878D